MAEQSSLERQIPKKDEETIADVFKEHGVTGLYGFCCEKLDSWLSVSLNVAVTGASGKGKSSLINAMLNIKEGDEGAAFSDVKGATIEIKKYQHPSNKKIVFWDLPGVGSVNFEQKDYLEKVKLNEYDFFIIVSAERFLENDGWLAKEIMNMEKRFLFVRTKVDNDVRAEKRSKKNPRTQEEILTTIRLDCEMSLKKLGLPDSPVYLIDNFSQFNFDFDLLSKQLIHDLPMRQRETLAFSIKGYAGEVIREKKIILENRIPKLSIASAVAGAAPIPGLGLGLDLIILMREVDFYREQFGLTDAAIKESAEILGMKEEKFRKDFDMETFLTNCTVKGIIALGRQYAVSAVSAEAAKYAIPILGSLINGTISYKTTSYCLTTILEDVFKASLNVSERISLRLAETYED